MSEVTSPTPPTPPSPSAFHRPAALIGGAIGLVALGALATVMVVGGPDKGSPYLDATAPAMQAAEGKDAAKDAKPAVAVKPAPAPKTTHAAAPEAPKKAAAPVCANCGVVEAVTALEQKGEGTGLGAVAGGVIGGVLGHQVGGGDGKKLATVVGAVGGGLAGHEIEKRQRATTVYEIKVRMADGSLRTVKQAQQLAVGQQVKLEGEAVKPA